MRLRIVIAYGVPHAVAGVLVLGTVAAVAANTTLGMMRQPMPMVWPLAVLLVVAAQLPLREPLGTLERAAVRGRTTRGLQTTFVALLLVAGGVAATPNRPELLVLLLFLAAVGFASALLGFTDTWIATLTLGMVVVGLAFITPLGAPIGRALSAVPVVVAVLVTAGAAGLYVRRGPRLTA